MMPTACRSPEREAFLDSCARSARARARTGRASSSRPIRSPAMLIPARLVEQTGRIMLDPVFDSAIARRRASTVEHRLLTYRPRDQPRHTPPPRSARGWMRHALVCRGARSGRSAGPLAGADPCPRGPCGYGFTMRAAASAPRGLFIEGISGGAITGSAVWRGAGSHPRRPKFINEARVAAFRDGRNLHSRIPSRRPRSPMTCDHHRGDLINPRRPLYGTQALTPRPVANPLQGGARRQQSAVAATPSARGATIP